jgi:hypothetical protein
MSPSSIAAATLEESEDEGFLISYMTVGYDGTLRPI